jgi:hypothetical protein
MNRNEPFIGDRTIAAYAFEGRMCFRERAALLGNDPVGGVETGVAHSGILRRLRRVGEALDGFNPDDGGHRCDLEAAPGNAEVFLDRLHIEPTGNLLGGGNREFIPRNLAEPAAFELVFEGFALCFGALEQGIGMAELVGQHSVGEVVESGYSC